MARDILTLQVSTVSSEFGFSVGSSVYGVEKLYGNLHIRDVHVLEEWLDAEDRN